MKKFLTIFSYLFHPIFIPLMGCGLFFIMSNGYYFATNFEIALILFQVIIITILIPISFYYLLKSFGMIDSVMVIKLSQRKIPLIIQAFLIVILIKEGAIEDRIFELYYFFLGGFISTLLILFFLFLKSKISVHMVGMASLLFFVIGLSIHNYTNYINLIAILLVITGFVATSRLVMKAHNFSELIFGFASGMVSQIIFWKYWV